MNILLDVLVEFALDDYSMGASITASYWISQFTEDLLRGIEDDLLALTKQYSYQPKPVD
ncbi:MULTISPECIES: hypothetical protein [Paenibacillus]|uniref:hypothetical protein n=1 Tax=Paenibacillus TaxID=44249 RepID=UPI0015C2C652|nr:hypothetical protein [Paenibacillus borealis]